jgi:hypothetical protein
MFDVMRSARWWALVGVVTYTLLAASVLAAQRGDPEWFVHFGSDPTRTQVTELAKEVYGEDVTTPNVDGHDGQAFWLLARDPLLLDTTEADTYLDRPLYRSQRLLYPLLAAPFRLISDHALIVGLIIVNLVSIALGAAATARLAQQFGAHRWSPVAYLANPATVTAVLLSTADALAITACLWGIVEILDGRDVRAGLWFAATALAKEVLLVTALAMAVVMVARGTPVRRAAIWLSPGIIAAVAWGTYIRTRLDETAADIQEITVPFGGYITAWRTQWSHFGDYEQMSVALLFLGLGLLALWRWITRGGILMWAAAPFAGLTLLFTKQVVGLSTNIPRTVGPLLVLLLIDVTASNHHVDVDAPAPLALLRSIWFRRSPADG